MTERTWETDLECRVGLALPEKVTTGDDAGIDVLCEVEVDDAKTWVAGRVRITGDHALRGRDGWWAHWTEMEWRTYLHDDELG